MTKNKRFLIWSSDIDYEKDYAEDMACEYPELNDKQRYEIAVESNMYSRDDECINLHDVFMDKHGNDREVIMVGRLQRWNGPFVAAKSVKGVEEVLGGHGMDSVSFYVEKSDLTNRYEMVAHFADHDDPLGQTFMHCLLVKENLSDLQRKRMDMIIHDAINAQGNVTDILTTAFKELKTYTESPANGIAKVYGWKLTGERKETQAKNQENENNLSK